MRLAYAIPLAVFLFILGLGGYMLTQPKTEAIPSGMVSKQLPDFDLPPAIVGMRGTRRADLIGGEPKLLNFWGSWCVPCIAEAPHLDALKAEGVEIVGIALRDTPENVSDFLAQHGNPYSQIGLAEDFAVMFEFGGSGVPETFVVDAEGVIRYQHIGDIREEHVPLLLKQLEDAR